MTIVLHTFKCCHIIYYLRSIDNTIQKVGLQKRKQKSGSLILVSDNLGLIGV